MIIASILTMISGTVCVDHAPIGDQLVLIIDAKADSILHSVKTDKNGTFSWNWSHAAEIDSVYVLAKIRTADILATEYQKIKLVTNSQVNLNVSKSDLQELRLKLSGDSGIPSEFLLRINAESVEGIPKELNHFLVEVTNAIGEFYYEHSFSTPTVSLKIKRGSYVINAERIVLEQNQITQPNFHNYILSQAFCDAQFIQVKKYVGFVLVIDKPKEVVLKMRILNAGEL